MAGLIRSLRLKGHDAVQHEGGVGTSSYQSFPALDGAASCGQIQILFAHTATANPMLPSKVWR